MIRKKFLHILNDGSQQVLSIPTEEKPECMKLIHDSDEFRTSPGGYNPDFLSQEACKEMCNDEKADFAGLMSGRFCLCSNTTSGDTLPDTDCLFPCSGIAEEFCGSDDMDTLYVLKVKKMGSIHNISVEISSVELFTDVSTEITVLVDSDTPFTLSLYFGDGSSLTRTSQESPAVFKNYYRMPGEYKIRALAVDVSELYPPMFEDLYLTVEERTVDFEVECPKVIEPGSTANCTAVFYKGTQLSMEYQISPKDTDETLLQYAVPDVPIFSFGQFFPLVLEESAKDVDLQVKEVHLPYLNVNSRTMIAGIRYYAAEPGLLELLVLMPCATGAYCTETNTCDSACSPYDVHECDADKSFCSPIARCVRNDPSLSCFEEPVSAFQYEVKQSFLFTVLKGSQFIYVPASRYMFFDPGDRLGFRSPEDGGATLQYRKATTEEISSGMVDTDGTAVIGVRHYIHVIVIEPVNVTLPATLNNVGNFSLKVITKNAWTEDEHIKETFIPVQIPIVNASLHIDPIHVVSGKSASVVFLAANGSDVVLVWDYGNGTVEEEIFEGVVPLEGYTKPIMCGSSGNYLISVNASNLWGSVITNGEIQCIAAVTKNWEIITDSPQITPPGTINIRLICTLENLPGAPAVEVVFDFGDGTSGDPFKFDSSASNVAGKWEITVTHDYDVPGPYDVAVNISNTADLETFHSEVVIQTAMGELSVDTYYVKDGIYPDNKEELMGLLAKDTAPLNSTVYFECKIEGAIELFMMKSILPYPNVTVNSSSSVIPYIATEAGDWTFSFVAWNKGSSSNEVEVAVKVVSSVTGVLFEASTATLAVEEQLVFKITLQWFDFFSCIIFDGGDHSEKLGFGTALVCTAMCPTEVYKFVDRDWMKVLTSGVDAITGKRRRREVVDNAEWIDGFSVEIKYQYDAGGDYQPSLSIHNPIFHEKKSLYILVTDGDYIQPLVYIDENSTDINNPIGRERGKEFRLETTAVFRNNESYSATHRWSIFRVDESGKELDEIDVTVLKTHNCSAIRIPKRFLDYGLYIIKYNLTVMIEEPEPEENTEPEEKPEKYTYEIFENRDKEEDEIFDEPLENFTVLGYRTTYTYLRIIPTPLIPMLIEGGASQVTRGFGQKIFLRPMEFSVDPDDQDDKNFIVKWFCKKFEEELAPMSEHEFSDGIPSAPILDRTGLKEEDNRGGCFGKGPGLAEIGAGDFDLKTDMFWTYGVKYEMIAVIKKDIRITSGRLVIDVIKERPPSIRVLCEKRIACFPEVEGQYINPNSWVSLMVQCLEDCGEDGELVYTWQVYASDRKTWAKTEIKNWQDHVIIDYDRMGVNQSLYAQNPEYRTFLINVVASLSNPSIPKGESSLFLLLNASPKGGGCTINTTSGLAMIDIFLVEFKDWTDEDNHKIIDYSIYVKYGEEYVRLQYGVKKYVDLVLPYGDLEIWCTVEDALGGSTTQSVANFTTTLPTEEQIELYDKRRIFDRSLAEGRMFTASQIIMARNSILMENKKRKNETGDFGDVSEAAINVLWDKYLSLDGIDSSYYTPQAREEILEELREEMEKRQDESAKMKTKEISKLLRLPMDSLPDAEIFGGALNSIADNGPINKGGKKKVMHGMKDMYRIINSTAVPHPEDKQVVLNQFGGIADTMAESFSQSIIGGNILPGELKQAEEQLDHNVTEPNYFIYYVEGNRNEVKDRLKKRAVDAAVDDQMDMAKGMTEDIKAMLSTIQTTVMEDIMVGEDPFIAESKNGFQMILLKKNASELSGTPIQQGKASVTLPDICVILGKENCEINATGVGVQAIKWSTPLESYGSGADNLSPGSNIIQLEITNRDGNSTLSVNNTKEPFVICIPHSSSDNENSLLEYVVPKLERDDDILVYHSLTVDSPELGVNVELKPDDPKAPLIVLYKYGNKSALSDYDGMLSLQNMSENNGVYSAFIDSRIITEGGKVMYVGIGHLKDGLDPNLIFENPDSLKVVNMTNVFSTNYSVKISTAGCYYFDENKEAWSSKGCKVTGSDINVTCCECNHLTSFGSGFFVMPNTIDFDYVFANAGFEANYTIYGTIIVTFSLFIIFLIFARWKDRKDIQKLGASPLPDNEQNDKYLYEILVFTGYQRNAGTKSNVFFIVSGEDDETEVRHLADDKRPIFRSSAIDVFVMSVPRSLGQLSYLRIWHDNSGKGKWSSWYVKYVVFRDVQTGHKFEFIINRWLAVEEDDGLIDRLIPIAGKEQSTEFSHLFSTASQRNLADRHLWFSVFLRPPRSRFTRVQRVSCCIAVLYLSMLVNAMYYQRTTPQPSSGGFKLGPLSLTPEEIAVGIISNVIIFPPTFLMIFFFRKSRPRTLRPSRIQEALKNQRSEWKRKNPEHPPVIPPEKLRGDEEALLHHRKRKFTLPWWCVIFGWFFVIASIGISIFFLWAYGISFGDEKTMNWLISLIISFFSSVLITQPIKIVLMAILVSCICRSVDYDEDDADEDEEDPQIAKDEEYLHEGKKVKRAAYRPMDLEALEEARKEREKEVKMYSVLREIGAYFLFLWIIMILSFGNRDPNNFYLREALINGFIKPGDLYLEFNNVNTERRFWNWTHNALVPELFAFPWYNNRTPLGLRLYLDDRNNLKIGYAILRQVRIKPKSCSVHWLMDSITSECAGFGSVFFEDGAVYTRGWRKVNSEKTPVPPEYKYLSASQLKGFPFWGQMDWYGGGGYVVPLLATKKTEIEKVQEKLKRLEMEGWINRHTRAVFVEFGTYNAQINLFCAVTIVAEFLPGGGVIPYYHIDPVRLLSYHTGFGLFQIVIEILFVIFTIFFTVREFMNLGKQGFSYFKDFWNVLEVSSILVSYCGIGLHIYKLIITSQILKIFTETEGTGYVKLQEAVLLDSIMCYQIGFIMSVSTLKFLKLLRFNRRIGVLSSTLKKCAEELQGYSVCLMVVFVAFVILFWLLVGRNVREFSTFVYSFESSISMMLKKFNYEDMHAASPIFAPIAFFTFSLATAVVLINILLSIIIQSFEDVNHDVGLQGNEYEILDFFINRVKMTLGCGKAKVRPLPAIYRDKKKPVDTVASFPGKVDKLVDFINTVYFQEQMDFNSKEFLKKMNVGQDRSGYNESTDRSRKKTIPNKATKNSQIPKGIKKRFDDF